MFLNTIPPSHRNTPYVLFAHQRLGPDRPAEPDQTQNRLADTQSQLSTGLAIQHAPRTIPSYWSISQTMNSDNGALGAVSWR